MQNKTLCSTAQRFRTAINKQLIFNPNISIFYKSENLKKILKSDNQNDDQISTENDSNNDNNEKRVNNEIDKGIDFMGIDLNNYKLLEKIGHGGYGDVYQIKNKKTGEIYAAKIFFKPISAINNVEKRSLYRELNIMAKITHPNIVKFIGFSPVNFHGENKPVILTELASNGSLEVILNKERKGMSLKYWDDTHKLIAIYSIASAMSFLHSHEIIHRDLKPENVLIDDLFHPKIADFGLSKFKELNQNNFNSVSTTKGTPMYMAPEIWRDRIYTKAGDVYAYGMTLYELWTEIHPFNNVKSQYRIYQDILHGVRPKIPNSLPEKWKDLIEHCWDSNRLRRPTFEQIVNDLKTNKEYITDKVNLSDYQNYMNISLELYMYRLYQLLLIFHY